MALPIRQQRFVDEYLIDLNATQAAIRAGYSAKTANTIGPRLLVNVRVAAEIERRKAKASTKLEITRDRVLKELARIAFSDLRRVVDFGPGGVTLKEGSELADDDAVAIESVGQSFNQYGPTVKVKLYSKTDALEKLAKHLGLFNEERSPLDALLDALPAEFSRAIRDALAKQLSGGGSGSGGGPGP